MNCFRLISAALALFTASIYLEYDKLTEAGFSNIFYINSEHATGDDHEGTVDGVHFTDLGFLRYADFLIDKFIGFGLITDNDY